jgi:hypothetical protein
VCMTSFYTVTKHKKIINQFSILLKTLLQQHNLIGQPYQHFPPTRDLLKPCVMYHINMLQSQHTHTTYLSATTSGRYQPVLSILWGS